MIKKKRIASIDYGQKRIGIALSDEFQMFAHIMPTILASNKRQETINMIVKALEPYEIDKIIVGLPLKLNGTKSSMTLEVEQFIEDLKNGTSFTVMPWDERLTTTQADRTLKEANLNRKKRAQVVDGLSAVVILQSYLTTLV
ncbi:MAG: Holliday junction resolvase RuvX [Parachlamydiales bacterium]|nr:Holliday junction resolvase RuvX [Parachlamydiales bacterium]